jgi:L-malate glycosyltransferase
MRVLFFNYEYPPLGAGAANATFCILQEFSKNPDLEVDLVTSSADNKYHLDNVGSSIRVHKLPIGKNKNNLHYQSNLNLLTYSFKAYFFARKLAKKNKYNLSHSFFSVPCGFISLLFKWQYSIPYVVSLRGADVPGYSDRFTSIYNLLIPIIRLVWKSAAAVVSNSQGLKELALKARPDQKIEIIFNGVDIEHFKPKPGPKNKESFIITLGASRVTTRKGMKYLIEAVDKLLPKYPNICLKIIGDGNGKEKLENFVKEIKLENNVKFLGRIPREKTTPYYQEASVFVLPSLNEGMSNAMLEALATGLLILATETGGTRELLKDGINGFILKMKDSDDIAKKLEKLILDKNLGDKMAQESRKMAMEHSWENVADKYLSIYREVSRKK